MSARRRCPAGQHPFGHGDLLGLGGLVGRRSVLTAAVAPGLLGELQPAVEAVAVLALQFPPDSHAAMADEFAPPEDAGAAVETGAAAGGLALRDAHRRRGRRRGGGGGLRGAGHPRRHLAARRQTQPLARGDQVRVGHLAAVDPPHGGPVGRLAVGISRDRRQRIALLDGVARGDVVRPG